MKPVPTLMFLQARHLASRSFDIVGINLERNKNRREPIKIASACRLLVQEVLRSRWTRGKQYILDHMDDVSIMSTNDDILKRITCKMQ